MDCPIAAPAAQGAAGARREPVGHWPAQPRVVAAGPAVPEAPPLPEDRAERKATAARARAATPAPADRRPRQAARAGLGEPAVRAEMALAEASAARTAARGGPRVAGTDAPAALPTVAAQRPAGCSLPSGRSLYSDGHAGPVGQTRVFEAAEILPGAGAGPVLDLRAGRDHASG